MHVKLTVDPVSIYKSGEPWIVVIGSVCKMEQNHIVFSIIILIFLESIYSCMLSDYYALEQLAKVLLYNT